MKWEEGMSNKESSEIDIPKEAFDGEWWRVPAQAEVECPECGAVTHDQPHVSRYVESLDPGGGRKESKPFWPKRGWLVWWECHACEWDWVGGHDNNYATMDEIRGWIAEFQKWYLSFKWERR
jgi:hypothetical protein